jgi:hypothetical protein
MLICINALCRHCQGEIALEPLLIGLPITRLENIESFCTHCNQDTRLIFQLICYYCGKEIYIEPPLRHLSPLKIAELSISCSDQVACHNRLLSQATAESEAGQSPNIRK